MRLPHLSALGRQPLAGPLALCWLLAGAASIKPILKLGQTYGDTDDAMRLVEARALLNGRGWYDLIEPRLAPPEGLHSHWSRFVDAPIATLLGFGQALFGETGGELFVRILWPLLLFGATTYLLLRVAEKLGDRVALWIAAALAGSCGMLWLQFEPGRLDHHNVQLMLMAGMMLCALDFTAWRNAAIMGALAAFSLAIGFESLPVIAWAGGLAAFTYVFTTDSKPAQAFGLAFAGVAALAFAAQTPPSFWTYSACDALAFNGLLGAVVAGLGLAGAARRLQKGLVMRLGASATIGASAAIAFIAPHPSCLHGPYADIDARLFTVWLSKVGEAQPLHTWLREEPIMAFSGALLPLGALAAALVMIARGERRLSFCALTGLLALNCAIGALQVRGLVLANAAAIPLAAAMLAQIKPRMELRPMTLGLALGLLASPLVAQIALSSLLPAPVRAQEARATFNQESCFKASAFDDLKALPAGVVMTDLDAGPHVLALTHHAAVAAPYQRIDHAMIEAMLVFTAQPREAASIIRESHATYIALCRTGAFAANAAPNTLAERLLSGHPPSWAVPLPSPKGGYALFQVERNHLPWPDEIRGREES